MHVKTILLVSALCCTATVASDDPYFPIKTKNGTEGITAFEAKWFGHALARMNEPRLPELAKDPNAIVYRILILPTWGNPIAVRATKHSDLYTLSARRLDGEGGYDPGKLAETKDTELGAEDSRQLEVLLHGVDFFEMSTNEDVLGEDGDESILEGVSGGRYHVVTRWCASSYKTDQRGLAPFLALSRFLVDKSLLSERPKDKGQPLF
jgi:hypothetical protein